MKSSSAGQANTKTSTKIPNPKEKSPWPTLSNLHEAPRSPIRSAQEPRLAKSAWLAPHSQRAVECRAERISERKRKTAGTPQAALHYAFRRLRSKVGRGCASHPSSVHT